MQASDLYHKLVYRDILAYAIPGALLVSSVWVCLTPIRISDYELKTPDFLSIPQLLGLLGTGFIVAHLLAILPRSILQSEKRRRKSAEKAFKDDRIMALKPWLKEAFENVFGEGSWEGFNVARKTECIKQWVRAFDLQTDMYNRIGALRLFCENATLIVPLILFTLATRLNIANLSIGWSRCTLISLGVLFLLLAFWGGNEIRMLQDREAMIIFVRSYFRNRDSMIKIPTPEGALTDKNNSIGG
ncbi:MAG TPA: hypothetical protein VF791_14515 [Pyrinomonadaceae bacterium]